MPDNAADAVPCERLPIFKCLDQSFRLSQGGVPSALERVGRAIKGFLAVAVAVGLLTGCGHLSRPVPPVSGVSSAEERILQSMADKNPGLEAFKGIGNATISTAGNTRSARVAWIGSGEDNLRIEILAMAGQPLISFADNGQWVTIVSHAPPRFIKRRSTQTSLRRILDIPVNSSDIIAMISGRVPVRAHRSVGVVSHESTGGRNDPGHPEPSAGDSVLVLKRLWGGVVQKINFDPATQDVRQIAYYHPDGTLEYRAVFVAMQQVNGFEVPSELQLSNDQGMAFRLVIERYWAEARIEPATFVLTPPGTAQSTE